MQGQIPLRLEIKRKLTARSDRVKCVDLHQSEPWMLASLYNGSVCVWNHETQTLVKSFEVCDLPVRAAKFVARKNWLVAGAVSTHNKTCVQTLDGHAQNVSCVSFHPELPIIITGSEDGSTVRIWHSNTYRPEITLSYGMERAWCVSSLRGSNNVALGYDEGSIIMKLGREEPAMSMDSSGKIIWARHSEIQQANLKAMGEAEIRDGERLPLAVKDMGSCEIYPQTVSHNPNGRFVVVCGDGEYIIYTAMALRNKSFGNAQEFVWAHDSSEYAIRESSSTMKIFKNFKERKSFKPEFGSEGIYGGFLLGVRSASGLAFYDWESTELIRRIEIQPKHVFWSDSGELLTLATEESFFVLKYQADKVAAAQETREGITEDGIDDAFEVNVTYHLIGANVLSSY
uniref:Beta'-coat protein n=2 Tax=Eptatretus burgeri TaxID=7764 RepID=A0A8C4QTK2_EPTBU